MGLTLNFALDGDTKDPTAVGKLVRTSCLFIYNHALQLKNVRRLNKIMLGGKKVEIC